MLALLVTTLRRAYRNAECVQSAPFGPDLWVGGEIEKGLRRGGIIISRMHIYMYEYNKTREFRCVRSLSDCEQEARIRGRKYSFFFPSFFANGHENDCLMVTKEKVSIATPESSSTMSKKKERNKIFNLTQRQKRCSFVLVWLEYRLSIGIL